MADWKVKTEQGVKALGLCEMHGREFDELGWLVPPGNEPEPATGNALDYLRASARLL